MITEGSKAVYAGGDQTIEQGTVGRVLFIVGGNAAHMQWLEGPRTGQVDLIDLYDLSATSSVASTQQVVSAEFDLALDMAGPVHLAIREAMDTDGEEGVMAALEESGHLAMLAPYVTEALDLLSAHLRADPGLSEVLAGLDDYERAAVFARVATSLLETEEGDST